MKHNKSAKSSTSATSAKSSTSAKAATSSGKGRHAQSGKGLHAQPKKGKAKKVVLIVVGVIVAIIVALAVAAYAYYHGKLSLIQFDDGTVTEGGSIDETDEEVLTLAEEMAENTADLEETEATFSTSDMVYDENVVNILLLGTDERTTEFSDSARSDSTMIVSLNLETGAIKLVSLERAIGVPILEGEYAGEWDWLTHVFRYGGADLMMKTVSYCFNIDIQYYIRVNFNTFTQIIDSVGGVDITLSQAEAEYLNERIDKYGYSASYTYAGENHLYGEVALEYARCRHVDSDWGRVVRQRNVIKAVAAAAGELSVTDLNSFLNTVLPLIKTNLPDRQITELLLKVPLFLETMDIEDMTLPVSGTYGSMTGMNGRSLYSVDFATNSEILHELIYGEDESRVNLSATVDELTAIIQDEEEALDENRKNQAASTSFLAAA